MLNLMEILQVTESACVTEDVNTCITCNLFRWLIIL